MGYPWCSPKSQVVLCEKLVLLDLTRLTTYAGLAVGRGYQTIPGKRLIEVEFLSLEGC